MRYIVRTSILALMLAACSPAATPSATTEHASPTSPASQVSVGREGIATPDRVVAPSSAPPEPPVMPTVTPHAPEGDPGTTPAPSQQTPPPANLKDVVWHGVRFQYDLQQFVFSETAPADTRELAAASLVETPNPCLQFPNGADCIPNDIRLHLYSRDGLDFWAWLAQQQALSLSPPEGELVDAVVAGRPAVAWPGDGIAGGQYLWYAVPVGADVLLINGVGMAWFVATLRLEQPGVASLAVGQSAATRSGRSRDLWSEAEGGVRIVERPQLYGGALVTILNTETRAVQVRTSEGVTGWIHATAADALNTQTSWLGEQARFVPFSQARIAQGYNIPLRENPRSTAPQRGELLAPGQEITVLGVRGDWLRVYAPNGEGWVRWHYDGTQYIDIVER